MIWIRPSSLSLWGQQYGQDAFLALRMFVSHPAFAISAMLPLAIAIAAATLVFALFNGLFLDSLPYPAPEQLVFLHEASPKRKDLAVALPDFYAWRDGNQAFANMSLLQENSASLKGFGDAIRIKGATVSHTLAATLGIKPILGRDLGPEDDRTGAPRVLLLGYRIWESRFRSSPQVIGSTILLDDEPWAVIGVLPNSAVFPASGDYWTPAGRVNFGNGHFLDAVGRLKPGVTLQQANQDLLRVHRNITAEHPENKVTRPVVSWLRERYLGNYRVLMQALLAGVAFLLFIACANVAGVIIARGIARLREVAVRLALGATRGRIIRQLMTESLLLAIVGNIVGSAAGMLALRLILHSGADVLPPWVRFPFDFRLALFSIVITVLAAVFAGLGPALALSKDTDLRGVLVTSGRTATFSQRHRVFLNMLVVIEIALALLLSVMARSS